MTNINGSNVDKDYALKLAVKAINNSIGNDG